MTKQPNLSLPGDQEYQALKQLGKGGEAIHLKAITHEISQMRVTHRNIKLLKRLAFELNTLIEAYYLSKDEKPF